MRRRALKEKEGEIVKYTGQEKTGLARLKVRVRQAGEDPNVVSARDAYDKANVRAYAARLKGMGVKSAVNARTQAYEKMIRAYEPYMSATNRKAYEPVLLKTASVAEDVKEVARTLAEEIFLRAKKKETSQVPGKKIEKLGTHTGRGAVPWQDENPSHNTGYPATGRRKKNDVPSRDDMNPYPAVEDRADSRMGKVAAPTDRAKGVKRLGQMLTGSRHKALMSRAGEHTRRARDYIDAPLGSNNVVSLKVHKQTKGTPGSRGPVQSGKSAWRELRASNKIVDIAEKEGKYVSRAQGGAAAGTLVGSGVLAATHPGRKKTAEALSLDRAIGDQPKRGDGPSRDDMGKAPPETHKGKAPFTILSDISTAVSQDESKTSSALGDALHKLAQSDEKDHPAIALGKVISRRLDKSNPDRPRYASLKDFILRRPDPRYKTAAMLDDLHKFSSSRIEAAAELAGLGMIAAPEIDNIVAKRKARKAGALDRHGEISEHKLDAFRRISHKHHSPMDVAGLGVLAAPYVPHLLSKRAEINTDAMLDELHKLGEFSDTIREKIQESRKVDTPEAAAALARLKKLNKEKPSSGQIARGALVGAVVGPIANLASRALTGNRGRFGNPIWLGPRAQMASAAHGAVYGGALPVGRQKLEREAEKQKLKEYVGQHRKGTLRGEIRKNIGI